MQRDFHHGLLGAGSRRISLAAFLLAIGVLGALVRGQQGAAAPAPRLIKIADDVYARANMAGRAQVAYSGSAELELGGTRLELRELRGHTRGDTVVSLPAQRTVIAGDLVTTPDSIPAIVNYADGGNWTELGESLEAIGRMDFDVLVGGHGPSLTRADFAAFTTKVHGIRERFRTLIREKRTHDEIAQALIKEFNWGSGPAAGNLAGMMQELR
jgi:glyoxylase-like metal-dependent hydrolase (beta-lactamase superfamily II)